MKHEIIHLKDHFPFLGEDGKDPTLTTYLPDNLWEMGWQDKKHPAVVLCPGGGYAYVSKREDEPIALNLLPWGYNVFILNYSCDPYRFPTQLREVAAVMELIHANADVWHTDTQRIAIMGFSAGGHLAGHYSNCYDIPEVRAVFPNSKPVNASILCYPVITADPMYCHEGSFLNLTGCASINDDIIDRFSLDRNVTDSTPPAFLWHTTDDACVPVMNSILYAQALAKHKIPFSLHIYPYGCHGLATADDITCNPIAPEVSPVSQWLSSLKEWLKVTL